MRIRSYFQIHLLIKKDYLYVDKTNVIQMSKTELIMKINSIEQNLNAVRQDFICIN